MAVERLPTEMINSIVADAFERERPRSQEACCRIAARVSVLADDGPWTDEHVINVAADMARGLFGPAYERADYGQRTAWADMCERALRQAIV